MALLTESRLLTLVDLPVQLPQTLLPAGSWIALATVQLAENQKLDLRWLQLYIAELSNTDTTDPCGAVGRSVINTAFTGGSLASVFLIKDWAPTSEPWTQNVLDYLTCPLDSTLAAESLAPIVSIRPIAVPLQVVAAGTYTLVALNNTTNRNIAITVDGAITIDTELAATE